MAHFFQGWRRKSGLLTLLLACVLTAAWLRSPLNRDYLSLGFLTDDDRPFIVSEKGQIKLRFYETIEVSRCFEDYVDGADDQLWHSLITVEPFTIGSGRAIGGGHGIVFSYSSIVLPLSLLSAYLLLSNPRKGISKKPTEPISREER